MAIANTLVKGNTRVAVKVEATQATATVTINSNTFDATDAVIVNGVTFTEGTEWSAGASIGDSCDNLAAAINASNNIGVSGIVSASSDSVSVVTLTASKPGTGGNSLTLAETDPGTDNFTLSGALFTGGSSTEGTAAAPTAGTDFLQVLEDGLEHTPTKESVERTILTTSIGKVTPRISKKAVTGSIPLEWRGPGVEGAIPDYDVPLLSCLGNRRQQVSRITTGSSHTTTTLNIATASSFFEVGDFIVILQAGDHHAAFVTTVNAGDIVFSPPMDSAPSDSVELAKTTTYFTANADHNAFTTSIYWGNGKRERGIGNKANSLSVENFTTGQIATLNFGSEGLSFDETASTASPFTPSFDPGLPPLVLSAVIAQDGVCLDITEFALTIENTIGFLESVKSEDGRVSGRYTERVLSGSFNPYKDSTSVAQFNRFNLNTAFDLIVSYQNPSSTTGEFELGSVCGLYLPNCLLTEKSTADFNEILTDALSFNANRGEAGTSEEIYMGFC